MNTLHFSFDQINVFKYYFLQKAKKKEKRSDDEIVINNDQYSVSFTLNNIVHFIGVEEIIKLFPNTNTVSEFIF